MIDTHAHIYDEAFDADRDEVLRRAAEAGVNRIFLPATDYRSCLQVLRLCAAQQSVRSDRHDGLRPTLVPMLGLHPEEVRADYLSQLDRISRLIRRCGPTVRAIGEVGLDFYWSREFEREQLDAFRRQIEWSITLHLPLMIHCRKAHAEMVRMLKEYNDDLAGGVFHCFSAGSREATDLLLFPGFMLGIGGVVTFKNSHLRDTLAQAVPMERIVLETDSPYLAPEPVRGRRNECANLKYICRTLANVYDISADEIERVTNENARSVFRNTLPLSSTL